MTSLSADPATANSVMPASKNSRLAYPPSSAERIGLASTTSFSGFLEVGKDGVLGETMAFHRSPNLITQGREQVCFDFKREGLAGGWQEKPHDLSVSCDNDRLILLEEAGGAIAKLSDSCGLHVVTEVDTV